MHARASRRGRVGAGGGRPRRPPRRLRRRFAAVRDRYARRAGFERHLARIAPRLAALRASGCEHNPLAVIAVESFFRPRPMRAVEYAAWAVWSLRPGEGLSVLSVGRSQAQLRHWQAAGVLDGPRFSHRRLRRVRSLEANYRVCRSVLAAHGVLHEPDPSALARAYTGGERANYASLLAAARTAVARC